MTVYSDNSLRPVAGYQYVPDSMEARGQIKPLPSFDPNVRNGLGETVRLGLPGFIWTFQTMSRDEMDWWVALLGLPSLHNPSKFSKRFTNSSGGLPAARLWITDLSLQTYLNAVIDVPVWESYRNGRFQNVQIRFSALY